MIKTKKEYSGISVSQGIALGKVFIFKNFSLDDLIFEEIKIENPHLELKKFKAALETCKSRILNLKDKVNKDLGEEKAQIFEAQSLILEDPLLVDEAERLIKEEKFSAVYALAKTLDNLKLEFSKLEDEYLKSRLKDIEDIVINLCILLLEEDNNYKDKEPDFPFILAAEEIYPSWTAKFDKNKILGFISQKGGYNSHSAILARSMGIPAIIGIEKIKGSFNSNDYIILDALQGKVFINPKDELINKYKEIQKREEYKKQARLNFADILTKTKDGARIYIYANIANLEDLKEAKKYGIDGIGLLRTEMMFLEKEHLPSEEEQFNWYQQIFKEAYPISVIIRALDLGADKNLSYLNLPKENNPALGERGIRLLLRKPEIFIPQLKAIFKASQSGNVKIMFPMVSFWEEILQIKKIIKNLKEELKHKKIFFKDIPLGIMLETPSSILLANHFAKEVDFFSIGSNDLAQYTLAVDRTNEKIDHLYQPLNPGVLFLIKTALKAAFKNKIEISLCGEMASELESLPILLGLGLRKLSVNPAKILEIKEAVFKINLKEAEILANKVLSRKS
ncbi:MAG: phosphoenolpyruvate--protein phosphotransferase [Armatimonadetes bacterium]|nr:phosphoenolpyruvate--protein phosphotransferase [Armatimonadota bacterium]